MLQFTELPEHTKRILFLVVAILGVSSFICMGISTLTSLNQPATQKKNTTTTISTAEPKNVSPLLFGTNLELASNKQQALPSAPVSNLLQSMHVQVVRMSYPEKASQDVLLHTAQY